MFYGNISLRDYDLQITAFCFCLYLHLSVFLSFFKAAKIINEMDSNLKNNILILQNIGRYINNASPKNPPHIQNVLQGQKL